LTAVSSSQRFRRGALAVALAMVFLAGMAARGLVTSSRRPAESTPSAVVARGAGPTRVEAGMPVGYADTGDGAHAAALAFTTVVPHRALYLSRDQVVAAINVLAANGAQSTLTAQVLADFDQAQPRLATTTGITWWAVTAVAIRTDAYTPERARFSVWVVRLLSKQGVVAPQSSWATVVIELVWERDDWRIWSQTSTPGPTPTLDASDAPATAAGLDARLEGFALIDSDRR
jgi:hypothetical protein